MEIQKTAQLSQGSRNVRLLACSSVGRSEQNTLQLDDGRVSGSHAQLRCLNDDCWVIRDLGSKNGTTVGGNRIATGVDVPLEAGAEISFGGAAGNWRFEGGIPAGLLIRHLFAAGRHDIELAPIDGVVVLPSPQHPLAQVFTRGGSWVLERDDEEDLTLANMMVFEIEGLRYQSRLAEGTPTVTCNTAPPVILDARLHLEVSQNEEHVRVSVITADKETELAERSHSYLLVVLARLRRADHAQGHGRSAAGWYDVGRVCREMGLASPEALNLHVYRLRQDFSRLGFADPGRIVERRRTAGLLRIGVPSGQLTITRVGKETKERQ